MQMVNEPLNQGDKSDDVRVDQGMIELTLFGSVGQKWITESRVRVTPWNLNNINRCQVRNGRSDTLDFHADRRVKLARYNEGGRRTCVPETP